MPQVWATKSSTFAVLYAPDAQMPDLGPVSKKKAKAREEEQARAAAVAEAQLRAHQATSVQVRSITPATAWLAVCPEVARQVEVAAMQKPALLILLDWLTAMESAMVR